MKIGKEYGIIKIDHLPQRSATESWQSVTQLVPKLQGVINTNSNDDDEARGGDNYVTSALS